MMTQQNSFERVLSYTVILLIVVASYEAARPFIGALIWAGILVVSSWGTFSRLERRLGWKRKYLALATTSLLMLVFVVPVVFLGTSLAKHVQDLSGFAEDLTDALPEHTPAWLEGIPGIGPSLDQTWHAATEDSAAMAHTVRPWIGQASRWLLAQGAHFASGFVEMLLAVIVSGLLFMHAETAALWVRSSAERLAGERGLRAIDVVARTVRGVMLGVVATAIGQAALTAIGLAVAGVPASIPLGFLSFVLCLAQLGTALVWIPAALWLAHQDHANWALALAAWGFTVNTVDHLVKPALISQNLGLPLIVIFMGVIGGVMAWGLIGIFLGATLLAVSYTLFRDWVEAA